jgi:hypothetical protein
MPQALVVRAHALLPEPGVNLDNATTIRWLLHNQMRISLWGPYQIHPDLYRRALEQRALLESGQVRYKAVDSGRRSDHVSNCIHAVSSVVTGGRLHVASPGWGETASYLIVRQMEPWIIDPCRRHTWLEAVLGLGQYPIIRRELENPRTGAGWTALRRVTGLGDPLGRGVIQAGAPGACCPPLNGK